MMKYQFNRDNKIVGYLQKYYPYIIFFGLILFLHFFMGFFRDDIGFSKFLVNNVSIMDFLNQRYSTRGARLITDLTLAILTRQNMYIWAVIDAILNTIAVYYVIKLVNKGSKKNIVFLGILLFFIFPYTELSNSGWMSVTVNYLWTFSLGIVSLIPLINRSENKRTSLPVYIISILALLFATNQEQCCVLVLGVYLLYLINSIINKQQISKYNIIAILIAIAALIFLRTSPGVALRYTGEMALYYPEFANFGIIEKLYLGTFPTLGLLIKDKLILALFYTLLSVCAFFKTRNKYLKYIFLFNIIFILSITIFRPVLSGAFPGMEYALNIFLYQGIPNFTKRYMFAGVAIGIYILLSIVFMLYYSYDNLFPPMLFLLGFVTRMLVGFSPTVFASGVRTGFFFYMILILLTLMLIKKLYNEDRINEKWDYILNGVFLTLAVLNYMHVFIMMW